ncbi:MAG: hypothetical protein ACYSWU_02275 [Planctomycetota bacterium]|jgi:hypothetical protein
MQSSTAVVFRALVMLACLVAIPLAAVVGKSLPDMVKGLLDGQWPGSSAPAYGSLGDAPRFEPEAPPGAPPAVAAGQTGHGWRQPPLPSAPSRTGEADDPLARQVVAAGHEVPVGPAALPEAFRAAGPATGASDAAAHSVGHGTCPTEGKARPAVDQFTLIRGRLRQLGATYYLLEAWGSQEQLYRFYCKVAVGGNPDYTHNFEATDADPLQAMARVLRQVEAWRAERNAEGGRRKAAGFSRRG